MKKWNASFYENDTIFQDVLGGGGGMVSIVSIGKEEAYPSVTFVHFKEKVPV